MAKTYGMGSVYQRARGKQGTRSGPWWIVYYVNGVKHHESSRSAKKSDAVALLRQRNQDVDQGRWMAPGQKVTVGYLLDLVLQATERHKSSWHYKLKIKSRLRPYWGHVLAAQVGTRAIRAYVEHRRTQGVQDSTINRELAILNRAFRLGSQHRPPLVKELPLIKMLTEPPPRAGFFEEAELRAIMAHLPIELQALVVYYYSTGCRRSEATALTWDQVDLPQKAVRLEAHQTKNKKPREIPLWGELLERLTFLKDERDELWPESPWVFSRAGEPITDFRWAWDAACKLAGLWEQSNSRRKGQPGPTRYIHDFRRTAVRNLSRAGVPDLIAMTISGHKTRSIFNRYNIVSPADLKDAARRMENAEQARKAIQAQPEPEVLH